MSDSTRTGVGDTGAPGPPGAGAEPRWPMATAVLAATVLYVGTPHRGRVPGWWMFPVVQLVLLGFLIAQDPGRIDRRSPTDAAPDGGAAGRHDRSAPSLSVTVLAYDILVSRQGRHRDRAAGPGRGHLGRRT